MGILHNHIYAGVCERNENIVAYTHAQLLQYIVKLRQERAKPNVYSFTFCIMLLYFHSTLLSIEIGEEVMWEF